MSMAEQYNDDDQENERHFKKMKTMGWAHFKFFFMLNSK